VVALGGVLVLYVASHSVGVKQMWVKKVKIRINHSVYYYSATTN